MSRAGDRPTGIVKPVRVESWRESSLAVYARIICTDEAGREWWFDASSFNFDLTPMPDRKED